jgi:mRNA-degrading endonuclease RelE of RelBE toxin-antitoxin system
MSRVFRIVPSSRFKGDVEEMVERDPDFIEILERCNAILKLDPYNIGRQHQIKKLTDVNPGEGQWRIRAGRYRLRYDIDGDTVILYSFRHRKEAY